VPPLGLTTFDNKGEFAVTDYSNLPV